MFRVAVEAYRHQKMKGFTHGWSTYPPWLTWSPLEIMVLMAGLTKGNKLLISPDHKAGELWGRYVNVAIIYP